MPRPEGRKAAPADIAGRAWLLISKQLTANRGVQTIGPDKQVAAGGGTVRHMRYDSGAADGEGYAAGAVSDHVRRETFGEDAAEF